MRVPRLPVSDRQDLPQRHLSFKRRFRIHKIPPVADTVDMYIHTNRGEIETYGNCEIGGLASNAGQFAQLFDRIRQNAAELLLQHLRQSLQMPCLVAIKSNRINELFYFIHRQPFKVFRTEHIPLCGGEQPPHSPSRALILRACGKDRTDQNAERIVCLSLYEFNDWGGMGLELLLQGPVHGGDVLDRHPTFPSRKS